MSTQDKLAEALRDAEATVLAFLGDVAFDGSVCGIKQAIVKGMFARLQAHAADAAHTRIPDLTDDEWMILFHERPDLKDRLNAIFDKAAYLSRYRSQCKTSTEAAQARAQSGEWVMVPREPTKAMIEASCKIKLGRLEALRDGHGASSGVASGVREEWDAMLAAAPQPQAAESHKGLLIGTTPSGVPYSLHGTKESVTAVSDMLEQAEVSRQLGADQPQSEEPVAYRAEWNGDVSDEGAYVYCQPNERDSEHQWEPLYTHPQPAQDAKDAARYQWWRANGYLALANGECLDTNEVLFAGTEMDEYTDAEMARESGR